MAGLAACGDDGDSDRDASAGSSPLADEQPEVSSAATSGVPRGRWTGTAHVTVDFADPGCATGSRSYDLAATLLIDDPAGSEIGYWSLSDDGDGGISGQLVNSAAAHKAPR
ncbi:hypothetical protein ACFWVC_06015 [Streptomyces sp. NPDC058691]|uniref:hypothetical protein n=1 Tax=Streptomyces sp. NPDC058691 TaxID=3346601 RepID=UPI003655EBA3